MDNRRPRKTGWGFGTFIYNGEALGATVWDQLPARRADVGRYDLTATPSQISGVTEPDQNIAENARSCGSRGEHICANLPEV